MVCGGLPERQAPRPGIAAPRLRDHLQHKLDYGAARACRALGCDPSRPPEYMDPYGFLPDDSDSILGVTTNFKEYMVSASRAAGHGGAFRSSAVEIECADSDVCGELSVYAVLNGMPAAPSGEIRMPWKHVVHVMKTAGCKIGDQVVQALVPLKKS